MLQVRRWHCRAGLVKTPIVTVALLLAVLMPLNGQTTGGAGSSGHIKKVWEATIEENASEVEYIASTVSPQDDSIWVVIGRRPAGTMSGPQARSLWGVDRAGKALPETSLDSLIAEASLKKPGNDLVDLAAIGDGNLAMIFRFGQVVAVNAQSRRVTYRKDLGGGKRDLMLTRAIPLSDGGLLLAGRVGNRADAIKLSRTLEVVWEKSSAPAEVGLFTGGAILEDGSFVLAGQVAHGRASMSLWAGLFNAGGDVVKSVAMRGQMLSVAAAPGGGCAVVQGDRGAEGEAFWFRNYDRDLKELWNVQVGSGISGFGPFLLSRVPGTADRYLIVGTDRALFSLSAVKAGSSILWKQAFEERSGPTPEPDLVRTFGLLSTSRSIVIPFTAMVVRSEVQREAVKIVNVDASE